uniref:Uncharacterized protein n=1 Tax=Tetranychus urticae TaxID=32264 RepID=T1KBW7_TETUR
MMHMQSLLVNNLCPYVGLPVNKQKDNLTKCGNDFFCYVNVIHLIDEGVEGYIDHLNMVMKMEKHSHSFGQIYGYIFCVCYFPFDNGHYNLA